jgi:outer membrane protein TolC
MMLSRLISLSVPLLASVCALSACTLGPNYAGAPSVAPGAVHAASFVRAPAVGIASNPAPNPWWLTLNDPQLNALIAAALAHNPDVHVAQARLREARAQLQQQQADAMPKASFDAAALRVRQPNLSNLQVGSNGSSSDSSSTSNNSSTGGGPLQLYTAGFDASWEVDLFGGTRRAVEAASAEAQAVDADLADTQVSLAAEVAQAMWTYATNSSA